MAKTKQFKTESKKLLDLMINSIYTHKEIFLRELISNASDAIDKRHYMALTNADLSDDYEISIELDNDARTITITDNGIGIKKDEIEKNTGFGTQLINLLTQQLDGELKLETNGGTTISLKFKV